WMPRRSPTNRLWSRIAGGLKHSRIFSRRAASLATRVLSIWIQRFNYSMHQQRSRLAAERLRRHPREEPYRFKEAKSEIRISKSETKGKAKRKIKCPNRNQKIY